MKKKILFLIIEIKNLWYKEPMAPQDVKCYNPAFDVTDHELISAIITDKGIIRPPFYKNLLANSST